MKKYKIVKSLKFNGCQSSEYPDTVVNRDISDRDTAVRAMVGMYIWEINHTSTIGFIASEFNKDKAFITTKTSDNNDTTTVEYRIVEEEE